ncbi:MAG: glycosyltransferase family 2 protein [Acidimicrobiia bacterium]|nr:glycosyltransferase family 2 protein [Acidimicrobiia bacterium]
MKLSVVILARNEKGNIGPAVDQIVARLLAESIDYEILVVDDGSTDGTADEVAARSAGNERVRRVSNAAPHGFGYAVRRGLDHFTGDAVAIMMADGSDSPDDLIRYYEILRDRAECAFGTRFVPGAVVVDYPKVKLVVNRLANTFIRLLFGFQYNDITNAFKAYRRNVIEGCRPFLSPHFNLTVELPLKAIVRGYSYDVLPISWHQRLKGVSALRMKEMGSRYLFIVLYVWLEKMLSRGDYVRPTGERFRPWSATDAS